MKALLLYNKGQWKEMKVEEFEKPATGKGELLIEVHAVGLNPVDYKTATGGILSSVIPLFMALFGKWQLHVGNY